MLPNGMGYANRIIISEKLTLLSRFQYIVGLDQNGREAFLQALQNPELKVTTKKKPTELVVGF